MYNEEVAQQLEEDEYTFYGQEVDDEEIEFVP
jgi:hypothetical protein